MDELLFPPKNVLPLSLIVDSLEHLEAELGRLADSRVPIDGSWSESRLLFDNATLQLDYHLRNTDWPKDAHKDAVALLGVLDVERKKAAHAGPNTSVADNANAILEHELWPVFYGKVCKENTAWKKTRRVSRLKVDEFPHIYLIN